MQVKCQRCVHGMLFNLTDAQRKGVACLMKGNVMPEKKETKSKHGKKPAKKLIVSIFHKLHNILMQTAAMKEQHKQISPELSDKYTSSQKNCLSKCSCLINGGAAAP